MTDAPQARTGFWDTLVNCICRPPRDGYGTEDLTGGAHGKFNIGFLRFRRDDFVLPNKFGQQLQCSLYRARGSGKQKQPCVIYCHCNSGSRRDAEEALPVLLPHGISVMCFDFAGSGLSDGGWVTLGAREVEDVEAVVEYLRSTGCTSTIGLWGRSMGAVTAMMYARRDPSIAGMVVDSPFSKLTDLMMELVGEQKLPIPRPFMRVALSMMRRSVKKRASFSIDEVAPLDFVGETYVPVLFGHATHDTFVGIRHSQQLYAAYAGAKQSVMFAGDHDSIRPPSFHRAVLNFFRTALECPDQLLTCAVGHTNGFGRPVAAAAGRHRGLSRDSVATPAWDCTMPASQDTAGSSFFAAGLPQLAGGASFPDNIFRRTSSGSGSATAATLEELLAGADADMSHGSNPGGWGDSMLTAAATNDKRLSPRSMEHSATAPGHRVSLGYDPPMTVAEEEAALQRVLLDTIAHSQPVEHPYGSSSHVGPTNISPSAIDGSAVPAAADASDGGLDPLEAEMLAAAIRLSLTEASMGGTLTTALPTQDVSPRQLPRAPMHPGTPIDMLPLLLETCQQAATEAEEQLSATPPSNCSDDTFQFQPRTSPPNTSRHPSSPSASDSARMSFEQHSLCGNQSCVADLNGRGVGPATLAIQSLRHAPASRTWHSTSQPEMWSGSSGDNSISRHSHSSGSEGRETQQHGRVGGKAKADTPGSPGRRLRAAIVGTALASVAPSGNPPTDHVRQSYDGNRRTSTPAPTPVRSSSTQPIQPHPLRLARHSCSNDPWVAEPTTAVRPARHHSFSGYSAPFRASPVGKTQHRPSAEAGGVNGFVRWHSYDGVTSSYSLSAAADAARPALRSCPFAIPLGGSAVGKSRSACGPGMLPTEQQAHTSSSPSCCSELPDANVMERPIWTDGPPWSEAIDDRRTPRAAALDYEANISITPHYTASIHLSPDRETTIGSSAVSSSEVACLPPTTFASATQSPCSNALDDSNQIMPQAVSDHDEIQVCLTTSSRTFFREAALHMACSTPADIVQVTSTSRR